MTDNPLVRLNRLGQSVWYDNIRRSLLTSGELEQMVRAGEVRGVTSNPAIFENAIARSGEYDDALRLLSARVRTAEEAYEAMAIEDIRSAADILRGVFDESNETCGFVSLEVSPDLSDNPQSTLREAQRLWNLVNRPNLMIKIPGTVAGLEAIRQSIAQGINVNVTLLFSVDRYRSVIDAYLSGLDDRVAQGLPLNKVSSVASFFVSRLDTMIDRQLDQRTAEGESAASEIQSLRGKAAIANTRMAYQAFLSSIESSRFLRLAERGAKIQRPLWASTSTKDPAYPDTYYVEPLIGRDTINTMPPATLEAYRDHGEPAIRIEDELDSAKTLSADLARCGISLASTTDQLEKEGILAFQRSFKSMLDAIRERTTQTE